MLPKAHLTSHSSMSGSRWVITPSWSSGSLRLFWYSSSVYSCHLFVISYTSVRSLPFLSFIMSVLAWNIPLLAPIFLKRYLVFLILLFSSICVVHLERLSYLSLLFSGTLHSVGYLSLSPLPLLLFFSQQVLKPPQMITLPSCISFSLGWFWSLSPVQCYKLWFIVLKVLCLPDLIPQIYSSPPQ